MHSLWLLDLVMSRDCLGFLIEDLTLTDLVDCDSVGWRN